MPHIRKPAKNPYVKMGRRPKILTEAALFGLAQVRLTQQEAAAALKDDPCDAPERAVHLYAVDLLRWTAGEPGTRFGKWLNQPNSKVMSIDKGAKG